MKKTKNILKATLWGALLLAVLIVLVYETGLLDSGVLSGKVVVEYATAVTLELLALVVIPFSLWLFKWKRVADNFQTHKADALLAWGLLRLLMLCIPMLACVMAYYLFLNPTFYYLALILAICLFFVYPSDSRCAREVESNNK